MAKTSEDQWINCPIVDGWKFEDVLHWSTVDDRESPVSRACSMRPPMSGAQWWSRAKAGASHWGSVPPQTARPCSAKKATVAVILRAVGCPFSPRRDTIYRHQPRQSAGLIARGWRMSMCWHLRIIDLVPPQVAGRPAKGQSGRCTGGRTSRSRSGARWSSGINAANGASGPRFAFRILPTVQRPLTTR